MTPLWALLKQQVPKNSLQVYPETTWSTAILNIITITYDSIKVNVIPSAINGFLLLDIIHSAEGLHLKRTKHFTFCLWIHPSINLSTKKDTSVIAKHKMEAICLKMCVYVLCIYSYPHFHWNQKLSEVYSSPCFDSIQSSVSIITQLPYANLWGPKYCGLTNPSFVFTCHTKHQSCFCVRAAPLNLPAHPPIPWKTELRSKRRLIRTGMHAGICVCH